MTELAHVAARSSPDAGNAAARERQHPYDIPYHWAVGEFYQYVAEQVVERVAPWLREAHVIDIGCGDGYKTALIARHARRVHGVDLNPRAIAFARLIVDDPHVSFEVGGAGDLERSGAVEDPDVITAFELIEHLVPRELDSLLAQARDVLSPRDGRLVVSTPNGARSKCKNTFHVEEFAAASLADRLETAGFEVVEMQGLYLQPPWRRLEHFATGLVFRRLFRALVRAGRRHTRLSQTLICVARPLPR